MVRIKPRSMANYSEEIKAEARAAFLEYSFIGKHYKDSAVSHNIAAGKLDDMPMIELAAFIISKRGDPAGVLCTGCGSSWTDERLAEERAKRPELVSCCPERKVKPVYWCDRTCTEANDAIRA